MGNTGNKEKDKDKDYREKETNLPNRNQKKELPSSNSLSYRNNSNYNNTSDEESKLNGDSWEEDRSIPKLHLQNSSRGSDRNERERYADLIHQTPKEVKSFRELSYRESRERESLNFRDSNHPEDAYQLRDMRELRERDNIKEPNHRDRERERDSLQLSSSQTHNIHRQNSLTNNSSSHVNKPYKPHSARNIHNKDFQSFASPSINLNFKKTNLPNNIPNSSDFGYNNNVNNNNSNYINQNQNQNKEYAQNQNPHNNNSSNNFNNNQMQMQMQNNTTSKVNQSRNRQSSFIDSFLPKSNRESQVYQNTPNNLPNNQFLRESNSKPSLTNLSSMSNINNFNNTDLKDNYSQRNSIIKDKVRRDISLDTLKDDDLNYNSIEPQQSDEMEIQRLFEELRVNKNKLSELKEAMEVIVEQYSEINVVLDKYSIYKLVRSYQEDTLFKEPCMRAFNKYKQVLEKMNDLKTAHLGSELDELVTNMYRLIDSRIQEQTITLKLLHIKYNTVRELIMDLKELN